jgi:outer membrane lipoprotein LolB
MDRFVPRRHLIGLALATVLSGCATPPVDSEGSWTSGRLVLRVAATPERASQGMSAAFELRGSGQRGELRLLSPRGTRLAEARWGPGLAVLKSAQGEMQFDSLGELSQQALGEALPLAALPDWLAGRPWPDAPSTAVAGGFEQLGWRIELARQAEGWIEARRAAPPAVELRVRLEAPAP